ncbi:MAG: hypothetical protein A2020_01860 [Lentisphaerae bacterium GWF2_45_14]|nr:MAG: hypothetical protein A2020_01860 [Lentisphaerae bacterium GWF2_45_14]
MNLTVLDRNNVEHQDYIRRSLMECYQDDPRAAKSFPEARAQCGFMNGKNYIEDFSRIITIGQEKIGFFLVGRDGAGQPWELGFLWITESKRKQGLGAEALRLIEEEVRKSDEKKLITVPHSKRSPVNGVPGFKPAVLHFFVKRGYTVQARAAGAYHVSPWNFNYDSDKTTARNQKNEQDGCRLVQTKINDDGYEAIRSQAEDLCRREEKAGWEAFFREDYTRREREYICAVLHGEEVAAVCAYSVEPCSPGIWGWGPQWGPLLTDSRYRGRGLAGWVITESLKRQFALGVQEVTLWTGADSNNSRMYERYGFRLSVPWFFLEKELVQ